MIIESPFIQEIGAQFAGWSREKHSQCFGRTVRRRDADNHGWA